MSDRDGNSFLWFLAGLGVGAVVGVLYAPHSGNETRDVLRTNPVLSLYACMWPVIWLRTHVH